MEFNSRESQVPARAIAERVSVSVKLKHLLIGPDYLNNKVTLRRQGAPLLYAYDAHTYIRRLRGIHGVPILGVTDALIIRPCSAIHTFGVAHKIDVAFMNREGIILKLKTVKPGRVLMCWKATVVLEMASGTAARLNLAPGQELVPRKGRW